MTGCFSLMRGGSASFFPTSAADAVLTGVSRADGEKNWSADILLTSQMEEFLISSNGSSVICFYAHNSCSARSPCSSIESLENAFSFLGVYRVNSVDALSRLMNRICTGIYCASYTYCIAVFHAISPSTDDTRSLSSLTFSFFCPTFLTYFIMYMTNNRHSL